MSSTGIPANTKSPSIKSEILKSSFRDMYAPRANNPTADIIPMSISETYQLPS